MAFIDFNELDYMPGGIRAGVERMDGRDFVHQSSLGKTLERAIQNEAEAHSASFDSKAFNKILRAIRTNKIQAWFAVVGLEIAGASIELPTVLTKWNNKDQKFDHYPAIYGEDTSVFSSISKEFRAHTKWGEHPNGMGLGTWFEQERIKRWTEGAATYAPNGLVQAARIGEYAPHSAAMIKIFNKLGAKLGTEAEGTVMELNGNAITPKWPVSVETKGLSAQSDGKPLDHVFLTSWSSADGKQKVVASFTEAISTFTGDPITRVQVTSNGNLPEPAILKDVMASLLAAGRDEAALRRWGSSDDQLIKYSPIINLHGAYGAVCASAFSVNAEDMLKTTPARASANPAPVIMRVHSFEKALLDALPDAKARLLGPHPMRPVVVDFTNSPRELMGEQTPPARPLAITETPSAPILKLAA